MKRVSVDQTAPWWQISIINHVPFGEISWRWSDCFNSDVEVLPTTSPSWVELSLHPTIEAFQADGEIASLNNRVYRTLGSSIIIPKKDKIELLPTRNDYHTISVDNSVYSFRNIERIEYQIDHHKDSLRSDSKSH